MVLKRMVLTVLVAGLLAGCGAPTATSPAASTAGATSTTAETTSTTAETTSAATETTNAAPTASETSAATKERVAIGLGYIPNVQFAPFYTAVRQGFYAAEGLDVEFSYGGNVNDLLVQTASGKLPFVAAAGDEILLARTQQIPVQMVFLLYQKPPVAVFSKKTAGIAQPQDLKGKTIGIPGRFGATYIGLLGLLQSQGLKESDVTLSEIGFAQFEAVNSDKTAAAVGFANNEPLRMQEAGVPVNVIKVADYIQLVNNGIVVGEQYAAQHPDTVRRFIRATRKGLEATIANPDQAFKDALTFIPELKADQQPFQRKVLEASLGYWHTPETDKQGLGWLNPQAWTTTYDFLRRNNILKSDTDPSKAYTMDFLK
jgi:NitT/TauT family transport system substrate-binding protein